MNYDIAVAVKLELDHLVHFQEAEVMKMTLTFNWS
jgi:hypothetical protein